MCLRGFVRFAIICVVLVIALSCQDENATAPPKGPTISFLQPAITVREPATGDSGIYIPVVRGDTSGTIAATYKVQSLTAGPEDFRSPNRTVAFESGKDSSWVYLELIGDTLTERIERLSVSLDSIPMGYFLGPCPRVTIQIRDRRAPTGPTISFVQPDTTIREGAHDGNYQGIVISVVRSDTTGKVAVPYALRYLTAGQEDISVNPWRGAWFEAGRNAMRIMLVPHPDTLIEGEEQITLSLGSLPAPYSPGWWPQLTVHIEDVEVHHDPMPVGWPLAIGNSWSYQVEWDFRAPGGGYDNGETLGAGSCLMTGSVRYRGRDYRVCHVAVSHAYEETDFFLSSAGDSLLFVPASDTLLIPEAVRASLPWVLAVFSEPGSVERTYFRSDPRPGYGVTVSGGQERGPAVATPAGAWTNTLILHYHKEDVGHNLGEWSVDWDFTLAGDVGPIKLEGGWWTSGPDGFSGSETGSLTGFTVQP